MARHIRKGDQVMVISGFFKGETGAVLRVLPKHEQVIVQGVNVRVRHVRKSQQNPEGGKIEKEMPIHVSNVLPLVDGKPTRVGYQVDAGGRKLRVAVKTRAQIGPELRKARTSA